MWNSPSELRRFDHLTLDTTHIGTWGDDPIDYYKRLGSRMRHVHLSNYTSGREHQLPEAGQLRLDRFVQVLANDGFSGAIVLEVVPEVLAAGANDEVIVNNMRATMELIRQWTAKK
jgi:sugar phosphate isomerase/epimerase